MKLRFRNNTLRLRVNRREVESLASGAALKEQIQFPGNTQIRYVLEPTTKPAAEAWFREGVIGVSAPHREISDWAKGDSIGMYFELPANGRVLEVSIEKDLECRDAPAEEADPDAFPRTGEKDC